VRYFQSWPREAVKMSLVQREDGGEYDQDVELMGCSVYRQDMAGSDERLRITAAVTKGMEILGQVAVSC
jgi:hypothetical protein